MPSPISQEFFEDARPFFESARFESAEVDYKLAFQGDLGPAIDAYRRKSRAAPKLLSTALSSPKQNMIDWRAVQPLRQWLMEQSRESTAALRALWFGRASLGRRVRDFGAALDRAGLNQTGLQLSVASTLLMGLGAEDHPPMRTSKFDAALAKATYPPFRRTQDAGERYEHALSFLDQIVAQGPRYGLRFGHRLAAQGVVWCVGGGWKEAPEPPERDLDDDGAASLIESPEAGPVTDKEALILARRGQGRFRQQLVAWWGGCGATGCRDLRLLRASHLKPWKDSTNAERLDRFNGVLLSAHLDAALDCGLISFENDGRVIFSAKLAPADRSALGLKKGMRLRRVDSAHVRYFKYHRKHRFKDLRPAV